MADETMQAGEQAEDQALQQIMQICQSAQDPSGYQQIMQIVQGLIQHNRSEEQSMGAPEGSEEQSSDMASRVMSRIKKNKGE